MNLYYETMRDNDVAVQANGQSRQWTKKRRNENVVEAPLTPEAGTTSSPIN